MTVSFWTVEVRQELKWLCADVGVEVGTQMFWAMQEVRDRYQASRGQFVTIEAIEDRHTLALMWNEMMDAGVFWDAHDYELALVRSRVSIVHRPELAHRNNNEDWITEPSYWYTHNDTVLKLNGSGLW
jgi:hypothetical protein